MIIFSGLTLMLPDSIKRERATDHGRIASCIGTGSFRWKDGRPQGGTHSDARRNWWASSPGLKPFAPSSAEPIPRVQWSSSAGQAGMVPNLSGAPIGGFPPMTPSAMFLRASGPRAVPELLHGRTRSHRDEFLPEEMVAIDGKTARRADSRLRGWRREPCIWSQRRATQKHPDFKRSGQDGGASNGITAIPQLLGLAGSARLHRDVREIRRTCGCHPGDLPSRSVVHGGAEPAGGRGRRIKDYVWTRASPRDLFERGGSNWALTGCPTTTPRPWSTRDTDGWNGGNAGPSPRRIAWTSHQPPNLGNGPNAEWPPSKSMSAIRSSETAAGAISQPRYYISSRERPQQDNCRPR